MNGHVTIVSCGMGPDDLTPRHHAAINGARILAGGRRLLAWFPDFSGRTITVGARTAETVGEIVQLAESHRIAVLASGDALFFGIARLFAERLPAANLTILPNVTAAQTALARLRMPWNAFRFFSQHGSTATLPWRAVLQSAGAVIYADPQHPPQSIAADLIQRFPAAAARQAAIVQDLGAEERIDSGTLGDLCHNHAGGLSMLVVLPPSGETDPTVPVLPLGLDDSEYEHEHGLITHPEIRAVVLAALRLRPGVLWDLGAGSGSVSIEAAGLCNGLRVEAVEAQPNRCDQIRRNATRAGCVDYHVVEGDILESLPGLPAPSAVFIGGGGARLGAIVEQAWDRLPPGGTMVATAVMEESRTILRQALPSSERQIIELAVRRATPLGQGIMMKPDNPIGVYSFGKR